MKKNHIIPTRMKFPDNVRDDYYQTDYWTRNDLLADPRINIERADMVLQEYKLAEDMTAAEQALIVSVLNYIEDALTVNPTYVLHHIQNTGQLFAWTGIFDINQPKLKKIWQANLKPYVGPASSAANKILEKITVGESFSSHHIWGWINPDNDEYVSPEKYS